MFAITKDPAVRLAKLRANECQVMAFPNLADLPAIKADTNLQLMQQPGLNIGYLAFNNQKAPFTDKRVRIAINMAIDKKAILHAVYQGAGPAGEEPDPADHVALQRRRCRTSRMTRRRRRSCWPRPASRTASRPTLWAMPVQRPYNPDARRIAELMQSDLAKVGIKAKIVSYEWGEYRKRVQAGEHEMAQLGWTGDNGDPDNFFVPLASCAAARPGGGSASKWCNQDFDALVNKAATLTDQAERAKLYEQAQVIMHEEAPFFLIAHSVVFMPMRKNVVGYKMSPFGAHRVRHTSTCK